MPMDKLYSDRLHLLEGAVPGDWASLGPFFAPTVAYSSPPVVVRDISIPGKVTIPARSYRPSNTEGEKLPALIWFHGGAFIGGDLDMPEADLVSREIAHRARALVISVDYRLCNNGVTFPAPQDDAVAAISWVQANRVELGVGAEIFTGGASAGGCLAGSTVQILRDRGLEQVKGALLIYPVCHAELPPYQPWILERMAEVPEILLFDRGWMKNLNETVMGKTIAEATGHDFPANAADLTGLPDHLIINSEYDNLQASGEAYAADLGRAGVSVEGYTELGAMHGHLNKIPAELPGCDNTINHMVRFMKNHLG